MIRAIRQWVAALGLALASAANLAAQAQSGFVPASQVATETLPAAPLVFIAYAFVWVALIGYVFALWRRLDRVERELAKVSAQVEHRRRP